MQHPLGNIVCAGASSYAKTATFFLFLYLSFAQASSLPGRQGGTFTTFSRNCFWKWFVRMDCLLKGSRQDIYEQFFVKSFQKWFFRYFWCLFFPIWQFVSSISSAESSTKSILTNIFVYYRRLTGYFILGVHLLHIQALNIIVCCKFSAIVRLVAVYSFRRK